MKNFLHRFITISMAALVLLSSTGFAFVEYECLMQGKSVKVFQTKKDEAKMPSSCCAKSKLAKDTKGPVIKKADCCKENQKFDKLEPVSSGSQLTAKCIKAQADLIPWTNFSYLFAQAQQKVLPADAHFPDISFSSILYGRTMRCFIQSFLI
jgi:hypothetical protein